MQSALKAALFGVSLALAALGPAGLHAAEGAGAACGPVFAAIESVNGVLVYRDTVRDAESLRTFHRSLPVPAELTEEQKAARLGACYGRAQAWFLDGAEAGDPETQYLLGHLLWHGYAFHPEVGAAVALREQGLKWLRRADSSDYGPATEFLIANYASRLPTCRFLEREALMYQVKADAAPDGDGVPTVGEVLDWLEETGRRGYPEAYATLGQHYRFCGIVEETIEPNPALAEVYATKAETYFARALDLAKLPEGRRVR